MDKPRDFLTGLVFFGLLGTLGFVTIFLGDFQVGSAPELTVAFRNIAGLEEGNEVRINGFRSGKVREIVPEPESDRILVTLFFHEAPVLFGDAEFRVRTASALGGQYLAIDRGTASKGPLSLDTIQSGQPESSPLAAAGEAMSQAKEMLAENQEHIRSTIANLDAFTDELAESGQASLKLLQQTLETANQVLGQVEEENLAARLGTVLDRLDSVTAKIDRGEGLFGALVGDPALKEDFLASAASLRTTMAAVEKGEGTLGLLLHDTRLHDRLLGVVEDLEGVTAGLSPDRGLGRLMASDEPWTGVQRTIDSMEKAARSVELAAAQMQDPESPLGFFLYDQETVPKLRRAVDGLGRFIESQRENAPLTTFASLLLSPF